MRALWLAAALLAAGCAQLETQPAGKPQFELSGRLAARQGDEAFSGNIAWRHADDADEMLITTALGQGVARIVRDGSGVVLTTAEPKTYRGDDVESISEQALGYRLPLAGLADWVQGKPSRLFPQEKITRNADGTIARLEQGGWRIEYQQYAEGRPSRLRLQYAGNIDLRLAVSQWK